MPGSHGHRSHGLALPVLLGILAGVLVVGAVVAFALTRGGVGTTELGSVVVILVGSGESGATVAQSAVIVRRDGIEVHMGDETATIPGTSFNRLGDAYSFGGGMAVARAVTGAEDPEWIAIPQKVWGDVVDDAGGIEASLTASQNVFDGSALVNVPSGSAKLDAPQLNAVLSARPFMPQGDAEHLRDVVVPRLLSAIARAQIDPETFESNLPPQLIPEIFGRQMLISPEL